jgi:hypothetical protein
VNIATDHLFIMNIQQEKENFVPDYVYINHKSAEFVIEGIKMLSGKAIKLGKQPCTNGYIDITVNQIIVKYAKKQIESITIGQIEQENIKGIFPIGCDYADLVI